MAVSEADVVAERSDLLKKQQVLADRVNKTKKELQELNDSKEHQIDQAEKNFILEKKAKIDDKYRDDLLEIKSKIDSLQETIDSITVDSSDESVLEARQKGEYLNQVAIEIETLYQELLLVSTPVFIKLADTDKFLSYKKFRKEVKILNKRINQVRKCASKDPFWTRYEYTSLNLVMWVFAIMGGAFIVLSLIGSVVQAVNRVKTLHKLSRLYHILVATAHNLSSENASLIEDLLEGVLITRRDTLLDTMSELEEELELLIDAQEKEKDNLTFLRDEAEKALEEVIVDTEKRLDTLQQELEQTENRLKELSKALDKFKSEKVLKAEKEREPYIDPLNKNRNSLLTKNILWKYTADKNTFIELRTGLFVYRKRAFAQDFTALIAYQLRNYMKWGTLNFTLMDIMMGMMLSRFMLSNTANTDIVVESLSRDFESVIVSLHETLIRRKSSVSQVANDINAFNRIQIELGSSILPYEFLIHFAEEPRKISDEYAQLFTLGPKMGIIPMMFVKEEELSPAFLKMCEKYVESIVEVQQSGILTYDPENYRKEFEKKLKNRSDRGL